MKIAVNLATRPFVELRPLFARLRLAMIVLTVLSLALGYGLHSVSESGKAARARMAALKATTAQYEQERASNERQMRLPQNAAVLERSKFLNDLFARKSFSWTAVMMDLETVLPSGVQVTSIEPVITKEGDVNIRLRVSGDRDRAVQLVRNLETSRRFLVPKLASETVQASETGNGPGARNVSLGGPVPPGSVEFDIISGYNPLPSPRKESKETRNREQGTASPKAASPTTASARASAAPVTRVSPRIGGTKNGVVLQPYVKPANAPGNGGPR